MAYQRGPRPIFQVATTGVIFAALVVAHLWRVYLEGAHVAKDPWFIGFTILAAGFAAWAWRVLRAPSR